MFKALKSVAKYTYNHMLFVSVLVLLGCCIVFGPGPTGLVIRHGFLLVSHYGWTFAHTLVTGH